MSIKITETVEITETRPNSNKSHFNIIDRQPIDCGEYEGSEETLIKTVFATEEDVKKYVKEMNEKRKTEDAAKGHSRDSWDSYYTYRKIKVESL